MGGHGPLASGLEGYAPASVSLISPKLSVLAWPLPTHSAGGGGGRDKKN